MTERTWVAVHAFGTGAPDLFLTDAVAPAVERMRSERRAHGWFYLRYWDGGPHVRVRVRTTPENEASVRAELHGVHAEHVRSHPSRQWMGQETYRAMAEELARREDVAHEPAPREADTCADYPYLPEHAVYGRESAMRAAEEHFEESTLIALEVITSMPEQSRRRGFALSVGLATAMLNGVEAMGPPPPRESLDPPPGDAYPTPDLLEQLERSYTAQRERLRDQGRALAELVRSRELGDDPLHRWVDSIRRLRRALTAARAEGTLSLRPSLSPLGWNSVGASSGEAVVTSVLMRCAHLVNNRVGVSYQDEMHINYLMARTFSEVAHSPSSSSEKEARR